MVLLAALFVVLVLASIAAWGCRRLKGPLPALTAGIVVGLIAGPTVAGRVLPATWEDVVAGAVPERNELRAHARETEAWNLAAAHAGAPPAPEHSLEATALRHDLLQAEARYRRPWLVLTGVLMFLGVAFGGRVATAILPGLTAISILYIDVVTAHTILGGWWFLGVLVGVAAVALRTKKAPQVPA